MRHYKRGLGRSQQLLRYGWAQRHTHTVSSLFCKTTGTEFVSKFGLALAQLGCGRHPTQVQLFGRMQYRVTDLAPRGWSFLQMHSTKFDGRLQG